MKKFVLRSLVYIVTSMILGMLWHFVLFKELYDGLKIYNRAEPIIPLGLTSMILQGMIMAYLYPIYAQGNEGVKKSLTFSLLMGAFLFSVTTIANAAKIEVASMETWFLIQIAFHFIQFSIVGLIIGLIKSDSFIKS